MASVLANSPGPTMYRLRIPLIASIAPAGGGSASIAP